VQFGSNHWRQENCEPCGADDDQNQFAHEWIECITEWLQIGQQWGNLICHFKQNPYVYWFCWSSLR
jgi:hypothetical protein